MIDDLIRRSDAIKAIEEHCFFINNQCTYPSEGCVEVIEDAINVPSADRPQGWIPCSERLPKESGEYLVYCEIFFIPDHVDEPGSRKGMAIAYYHREFNEWLGMDKVYAWMPLPKPYREREGEYIECRYEPKDEPQAEGIWNAGYKTGYDKGYKDAQKVKDSQELVKDLVKADRKTENSSEKPNNFEDFFREPTAEERKAVADYIDSISVPTGVNIFDLMDEPQTDCSWK